MNITLKVWRQDKRDSNGEFISYEVNNVTKDMSFLEMLDMLNNNLIRENKDPIAFDHDCREGICGTCGVMINGRAHGPLKGVTTCQLHMRSFNDGDSIIVEPWRAKSFPVIKDLVVDRTSLIGSWKKGDIFQLILEQPQMQIAFQLQRKMLIKHLILLNVLDAGHV